MGISASAPSAKERCAYRPTQCEVVHAPGMDLDRRGAIQPRTPSPSGRGRLVLALLTLPLLTAAAPQRVASLNLCTDELALLLAKPHQLASVSILGADPHETPLAARARGIPTNNGRMESVATLRPDLVLTGGGANRYAAEMAQRLGAKVVDVPPPWSLDELRTNIRSVAQAFDNKTGGETLITAFDRDLGPVPPHRRSAVLLSGGGYTVRADGLSATLLRHAGLEQQRFPSERVEMELLLANPPAVIVVTDYRAAQTSRYQSWLAHPALRQLRKTSRILHIDGRAWTCLGPPVAGEVAKLRARLAK